MKRWETLRFTLICLFAITILLACTAGSLLSSPTEATPQQPPIITRTLTSSVTETPTTGQLNYIVRDRDSFDKSTSILTKFIDKNFSTIEEYHDLLGFLSLSLDGAFLRQTHYDSNKGFEITEINLHTLERSKWFALGTELSSEADTYDYKLSPTSQWIAYKKMSTEDRFAPWDAEIQDVMLLKVDLTIPQKAVQLTQFGHAKPAFLAWSPDGRYLAFTDLDDLGRIQIYLYDIGKQQKIQVSHFLDPGTTIEIGTFSWSPDGQRLAFVRGIYTDEQVQVNENQRIGLVSLTDFTAHWLNISGFRYLYNNKRIIWNSTGTQFVLLANDFANTPNNSQSLIWVDSEKGTWKTALIPKITPSSSDSRSLQVCDPFLLNGNITGLVVEGALVLYNRQNSSYTFHSLAPMWGCAEIWMVP